MSAESKWVFWSTRETINDGVPSVTSIIETVIAVPLYWWISVYFETYLPLLIAATMAPLVLLRSDESTSLGIKWFIEFQKYSWDSKQSHGGPEKTIKFGTGQVAVVVGAACFILIASIFVWHFVFGATGWLAFGSGFLVGLILVSTFPGMLVLLEAAGLRPDDRVIKLFLAPAVALVVTIVVAGGWKAGAGAALGLVVGFFAPVLSDRFPNLATKLVFFPLSVPFSFGLAIGVFIFSVVIRIGATMRYLCLGLRSLPRNFQRLALCTSPRQLPELVPGLGVDNQFTLSEMAENFRAKFRSHEFNDRADAILVIAPAMVLWFFPAWVYRVTLKSTAWLWWPLAFLGAPPKIANNPDWFHTKVTETKWARSVTPLAYLSIFAFIGVSFWKTFSEGTSLDNPFLNVAGYALSIKWSTAPWQILGVAGSAISLVIIYLVDWAFQKYSTARDTNDPALAAEAKSQFVAIERLARFRTLLFLTYCAIVGFHAILVLNNRACWFIPTLSVQSWSDFLYREHSPTRMCIKAPV